MFRLRYGSGHEVLDAFASARGDIGPDLPDCEPLAYFDALAAGTLPESALWFCAYLLPRREAVWWGCRCLRAGRRDEAGAMAPDPALEIAEQWVARPEDGVRRAALVLAVASDLARATSWMALAAGWAGGSLALGEYAVPSQPHLTARAVRAGLLLALGREAPKSRRPAVMRFAALGRRTASGEDAL